ncbi:MAG: cyclase family protein [Actinomycetota bacterium]|nr:cyclase family protein [Actinomycetota bacterium]
MCLPGTVEMVKHRIDKEGLPRVSRRAAIKGGVAAVAGAAVTGGARALADDGHHGRRLSDLTHVLTEGFPVYTFDAPTRETVVTVENDGFYIQKWTLGEHSGTHMDCPGHFVSDGRRAPEMRLEELLVPIVVIDISRRAAEDPDAFVTVRDLMRVESRHGRIPRKALVAMYSGWESRVDDPAAYKNAGTDGNFHFPGFGIDALEWLLERRHISAVGVDTLSLDVGESTSFDVHLALLGADRYGLENLAHLKSIPARGARAYVGLIPLEEGSGGPCRIIATW